MSAMEVQDEGMIVEVNNNEGNKKPHQKKTAQAFFVNHYKSLDENKGKLKVDLAKAAAELWMNMNAQDREIFVTMADQDKIRYQNELAIFKLKSGGRRERGAKRTRREKDPHAPKKGTPAYFFFAKDHRKEIRDENKGISIPQLNRKLSEIWNNAPQEVKDKYNEMAAKDKQRYLDEKIEYENKLENGSNNVVGFGIRTNIFKRTKSETSVSNGVDIDYDAEDAVEEDHEENDS